jgi:hypothetical protein
MSVASGIAQEPDWYCQLKKIEPLKSTRDDVDKIFGGGNLDSSDHFPSYNTSFGKVTIEYSKGLCKEGANGWNVPEFTVTRVFVDFNPPLERRKFRFGTTGFKKSKILDSVNAYSFENDKLGVSYVLKTNGRIEGVDFYPPMIKDALRCK